MKYSQMKERGKMATDDDDEDGGEVKIQDKVGEGGGGGSGIWSGKKVEQPALGGLRGKVGEISGQGTTIRQSRRARVAIGTSARGRGRTDSWVIYGNGAALWRVTGQKAQ